MVAREADKRLTAFAWVRIYSYITLGGALYGVAWAHVPFIIGKPWGTCEGRGSDIGCVLAFHLFDVPIVLFNLYIAWYGLRRFSAETARSFNSLLTFAAVFNFVFFAFEINTLLNSLQRHAPEWESLALVSIALLLVCGTALTVYIHQRLITAYSDKRALHLKSLNQPTFSSSAISELQSHFLYDIEQTGFLLGDILQLAFAQEVNRSLPKLWATLGSTRLLLVQKRL